VVGFRYRLPKTIIIMNFLSKLFATKIARLEASLVSIFLVVVSGLFTAIFITMWLALFIGDKMHNQGAGFAVVAALFFLLFIVSSVFRTKKIQPALEEVVAGADKEG